MTATTIPVVTFTEAQDALIGAAAAWGGDSKFSDWLRARAHGCTCGDPQFCNACGASLCGECAVGEPSRCDHGNGPFCVGCDVDACAGCYHELQAERETTFAGRWDR